MAKACIINYNNRGQALLALLKTLGRIQDYYNIQGTPRWCFEFSGKMAIDFNDYLQVSPKYMQRDNTHIELLIKEFKDGIILPILNTISGGEVLGFSDTYIELEDTSKTATICARVTKKEREILEEEARKQGLSLSEFVRRRVLGEPA